MQCLNTGRVSALVTLVGNEFQEEIVLGTNECKNYSWCEQMVGRKKNAFDQHLLGQGTKADERRDEIMCNLKHCAELVM